VLGPSNIIQFYTITCYVASCDW